jgi:hypothetical protein
MPSKIVSFDFIEWRVIRDAMGRTMPLLPKGKSRAASPAFFEAREKLGTGKIATTTELKAHSQDWLCPQG